MNIYIDESGSINNKLITPFVICLVCVPDNNVKPLKSKYKKFVTKYIKRLEQLDFDRTDKNGKILKHGHKMFHDGKFKELKGMLFDKQMKIDFVNFFYDLESYKLIFIVYDNKKLTDNFCKNTARVFNYGLKTALQFFIKSRILPKEDYNLSLDERNERTETRAHLEEYLNTELCIPDELSINFKVTYFDSSNNKLIQIADVYSNLLYSQLTTNNYSAEFNKLNKKNRIIKIFEFPLQRN